VKNFNNSEVTIDFNHPLAGKDLLFNVKILSVRDATPDEILNSQVFEEDDVCGCDTGICY
jgi:FKBP-type peptidyl-prolyl cis-trans isomerase SlyD